MKEELDDNNTYITDCNHMFCKECLDDWFQRGNQTCPLCRSEINTYSYKDEKYKLIIHKIENNITTNRININDLINNNIIIRNIVRQNIRLRFYGFTLSILFLYVLNNYLYSLQNINLLKGDLDICNLNNTHLKDSLNTETNDYNLGPGYYVSMYNGELARRCFYPLKFYNICFNK
jgi:hypothetical protein